MGPFLPRKYAAENDIPLCQEYQSKSPVRNQLQARPTVSKLILAILRNRFSDAPP
jgi:hypothetical protein